VSSVFVKTDDEYFDLLNKAVAREMQVAVQYILQHTKMEKLRRRVIKENYLFGDLTTYDAIGKFMKEFAIQEMKHMGKIAERIYLLGGKDAATKPTKITIGVSLTEFMNLGLKAEDEALVLYRQLITKATLLGDWVTKEMFDSIYKDEENHLLKFQEYIELLPEPDIPEVEEAKWQAIFTEDYIKLLNKALAAEISAIVQYTLQHEKAAAEKLRMKREALEVIQGANKALKISDKLKPVFMEEMDHVEKISERIYEIKHEAIPDVSPLPKIGATPEEWILLDRDAENDAIILYRDIIKKARELGDVSTQEMFETIIQQEEKHFWTFDEFV